MYIPEIYQRHLAKPHSSALWEVKSVEGLGIGVETGSFQRRIVQ